jgi:glucose/arabinose dehydrogenase
MYVSVGSQSNVADDMPKKTALQIKDWEALYGTGATWGDETKRATVLVFETGLNKPGKVFANGIRNCVGLTVQPANGEVWCATNERDRLGDDLVPDYVTRVQEGGFYGWPWYYIGSNEDPRHKGARPDLADEVLVPDVLLTSHSAALNITFYTATSGRSAFPREYVGDAFAVLHGSWNRGIRTGHKVVRIRMKNDRPTGEYQDFMTGFIIDDGYAWGRPVAAEMLSDGSMLVSEDGNNVIYRISYSQ